MPVTHLVHAAQATIQKEPENAEAKVILGDTYLAKNDLQKAEESLEGVPDVEGAAGRCLVLFLRRAFEDLNDSLLGYWQASRSIQGNWSAGANNRQPWMMGKALPANPCTAPMCNAS